MKKWSLRKNLGIAFILGIIGALIITSLISNLMIGRRFNTYLINEHKEKVNNIVKTIRDTYSSENGISSLNKEEIYRYAVMEELYIEIRDQYGKSIYSTGNAHLQHKTMMEGMMGGGMGTMMGQNFNTGQYKEEKYPLQENGRKLGTIIVGYFGTSYLSSSALSFKVTLNQAFMISFFITLFLGLCISCVLSKRMSAPLVKITETAHRMREGDMSVRADIKSNTIEIDELSNSINYLAETLQKAEMLRKRLTSDMAHEIRTPLTTLRTHMEALIDGIWEPTKERFEVFYEELERLSKLVDNLRNVAKLESQYDLTVNRTKFSISEELEKIVDTFMPSYLKDGFNIETNITSNISVLMDKDMLKQIMHNLLSNARKYLDKGGNVIVTLLINNKGLILSVEDNGTGISKEDLPHIFERFYRSDVSRNKATGGSGLGLTIAKALVEAHGGNIHVESEVGKGTVFTTIFPMSIIVKVL